MLIEQLGYLRSSASPCPSNLCAIMNSLLSPKFAVICALFQPVDEDESESFWLQLAPRRGDLEVNSSQKGTGRASKATGTSSSTGHFQEVRGLTLSLPVCLLWE